MHDEKLEALVEGVLVACQDETRQDGEIEGREEELEHRCEDGDGGHGEKGVPVYAVFGDVFLYHSIIECVHFSLHVVDCVG
jgi:hypothetical protein